MCNGFIIMCVCVCACSDAVRTECAGSPHRPVCCRMRMWNVNMHLIDALSVSPPSPSAVALSLLNCVNSHIYDSVWFAARSHNCVWVCASVFFRRFVSVTQCGASHYNRLVKWPLPRRTHRPDHARALHTSLAFASIFDLFAKQQTQRQWGECGAALLHTEPSQIYCPSTGQRAGTFHSVIYSQRTEIVLDKAYFTHFMSGTIPYRPNVSAFREIAEQMAEGTREIRMGNF